MIPRDKHLPWLTCDVPAARPPRANHFSAVCFYLGNQLFPVLLDSLKAVWILPPAIGQALTAFGEGINDLLSVWGGIVKRFMWS